MRIRLSQAVYLTNGFSKDVKIGNQTIHFIKACPKRMLGVGTLAGLIIQALYYLGKNNINDASIVTRLRSLMNNDDKDMLWKITPKAPLWMQPLLTKITQDA